MTPNEDDLPLQVEIMIDPDGRIAVSSLDQEIAALLERLAATAKREEES